MSGSAHPTVRRARRRNIIVGSSAAGLLVIGAVACQFGGTDDVTRDGVDLGGGPGIGTANVDSGLQGLCARAGGPDQVRAITNDAVGRAAADCRIGAYFTGLSDTDKAHLSDCMTTYLEELFTCPGVTYAGSKDSAGQACRDMKTAHSGMGLTAADESAFQDAFVGALRETGKLVPTDVGNVVTQLSSTRNVYDGNKDYNPQCTCQPAGANCGTPVTPPSDGGGNKDTGGPPPPDSGNPPTDAGQDADGA